MKTYQIIQIGRTKVLTFTFSEMDGQTLDDVATFFNKICDECERTEERGFEPWTRDVYVIDNNGRIITQYHS